MAGTTSAAVAAIVANRGRPKVIDRVELELRDGTSIMLRLIGDGRTVQIELPDQWTFSGFDRPATDISGRTRLEFVSTKRGKARPAAAKKAAAPVAAVKPTVVPEPAAPSAAPRTRTRRAATKAAAAAATAPAATELPAPAAEKAPAAAAAATEAPAKAKAPRKAAARKTAKSA
jgi:hypothetical protein